MFRYGLWVRDGKTCQGVFNTSTWPEGKPPGDDKTAAHKACRKPLIPASQPKDSRHVSPKIPCTAIDLLSEEIHKTTVRFPDDMKKIIICLYIRTMTWGDVCCILGITSRQLGTLKFKVLKEVGNVLR